MTRVTAIKIRAAALRGEPVKAMDLQEAISILSSKRGNKMHLPALRQEVRERVNLTLMFNLGWALGASHG